MIGAPARGDLLGRERDGQLLPRLDRGEEPQVVHAVVGQHRARVRVDEQPGRPRDDQVAVRHPAAEERVGAGGLLVHVGVEGVAGELGEVLDVRQRHRPRAGGDRVADAQLGQRLAERVHAVVGAPGTGDPAAADRGRPGPR